MASRPIVPQQARGEAVVGAEKQHQKKHGGAAEGRNRRVLGDIGNQISRPMTRNFTAQLIAKAQAAAAVDNNKKQVILNGDKGPVLPVGKRDAGVKAVQKKAVAKSKPVKVVEISPDTEKEEVKGKKEEKPVIKNKEAKGSARKKAPTLTSVLTARSKAVCGLANRPKVEIVDIDAADINNHLAGVEYVEDMYKFYKQVENESRPHNYMELQPEINEKMRAILVDWLIDVHLKFELSPETFYLTINIIDRFLSVKTVPRRELQLVGLSATLMASKYEEIWAPEVNDLVSISARAYTHEQILIMEKIILAKLEWTLTVPTHYVFLARFIKAAVADKDMENMVYFLAELGMMNYDTIMYCPSMVSASAVYAARCTLNKTPSWTDTLRLHTGFSETQLKDCAALLAFYHSRAVESKLQTIYKKYSNPQRGAVALLPHAKALLSGSRLQ